MSHKNLNHTAMLITYPDSLGNNLQDLHKVLQGPFRGAFGGLHILPFFPSSGDRGFSPITYREVDPRFGTWDDIDAIGQDYYLMYDYMINHISVQSPEYQDFLHNKDASRYRDFFIRFKDFWNGGEPTKEEDEAIYRRRIGKGTYITAHFDDGTEEKVWCTVSDEQVDINCQRSEVAKRFLKDNLAFLSAHGCSLVRLDAFAYATKKAGTNCFFVEPEVWDLMRECHDVVKPLNVELLPEIHENYFTQMKLSERGYWVYDFQLPMLLLNAIFTGKTMYLKNWLRICSPRQFTTLDTHDGIGVVDARYLLPDYELQDTKMHVYEMNPGTAKIFSELRGPLNRTFNTYQINCSYFDACGADEKAYEMARAIQIFAPGIPQVYYQGLLAGTNDFALFEKTKQPRDVNRRFYSLSDIEKEVQRPVVRAVLELLRLRNTHPAFSGTYHLLASSDHEVTIRWENGLSWAELHADFSDHSYSVTHT
ncbi:MAG: sucrose phosphorylase [Clostridia bacterium]|nr:sucrose phosphorylase [Clostridia bacterium]